MLELAQSINLKGQLKQIQETILTLQNPENIKQIMRKQTILSGYY